MNFIMTGHKGLIGTFLMKRLEQEGHVCKMTYDLRSGQDVRTIDKLKRKADIVFHLAAHCKINEGTLNPILPFRNNVEGTFHALEFCRKSGIKKFIFFSTSRNLSPEENPYTASKKYGEQLCEAYRQCYGIEYIIVRPSSVYAPIVDETGRLLTDWCRDALLGKELKIYGDYNKTLDFTHIDDFNDAIMLLINNWEQTKNKAFDISGDREIKLVDIADMIRNEMDKYLSITWKNGYQFLVNMYPPEIAQPQRVKVDITEMKKLGYKPKISIEEGIKQLIEFYKNGM